MDILIAGKGFIGESIGKKLEETHNVKYLDRSQGDYQKDITEKFSISEDFDVLIHTIGLAPGLSSAEAYHQVHVEGTRNLLESVDFDKIVFLSALKTDEINHSFFNTKKQAEKLIIQSGKDYTILRPSTVYGEGNKLLELIAGLSKTRLFPNIKTKTQPIKISDLVEISVKSIQEFEDSILNVAGPEKITIGALAEKLYHEQGKRCLLIPMPLLLLKAGLVLLSFLPPPFQRENLAILETDNTIEKNDAEQILDLEKI